MALTNDQITAQNFKDFYGQIRPYLNGAAHSGFTPIGTIIAVMGNAAPLNYLACNGQTVNIADYSELATYFNAQFGSVNFFGGDGTTTFGIPDLRGEFLRGTGTNSHTGQGNGESVGTHQDATEFASSSAANNTYYDYMINMGSFYSNNKNGDSLKRNQSGSLQSRSSFSAVNDADVITSRPTNTSVLYCIATKNIFMDAGSNYSTEEQVVATWIDGKPVYRKIIVLQSTFTFTKVDSWTNVCDLPNAKTIVNIDCYYDDSIRTPNALFVALNDKLCYYWGEALTLYDCNKIKVEYTKTTD